MPGQGKKKITHETVTWPRFHWTTVEAIFFQHLLPFLLFLKSQRKGRILVGAKAGVASHASLTPKSFQSRQGKTHTLESTSSPCPSVCVSLLRRENWFNQEKGNICPIFTISGWVLNQAVCFTQVQPGASVWFKSERGSPRAPFSMCWCFSSWRLITLHQPQQLLTQNRWRSGLCKHKIPERQTICKHTSDSYDKNRPKPDLQSNDKPLLSPAVFFFFSYIEGMYFFFFCKALPLLPVQHFHNTIVSWMGTFLKPNSCFEMLHTWISVFLKKK